MNGLSLGLSLGLPNEIKQYRLQIPFTPLCTLKEMVGDTFPCYVFYNENEVHTLIFSRRSPALEAQSRLAQKGINATYSKIKWVYNPKKYRFVKEGETEEK